MFVAYKTIDLLDSWRQRLGRNSKWILLWYCRGLWQLATSREATLAIPIQGNNDESVFYINDHNTKMFFYHPSLEKHSNSLLIWYLWKREIFCCQLCVSWRYRPMFQQQQCMSIVHNKSLSRPNPRRLPFLLNSSNASFNPKDPNPLLARLHHRPMTDPLFLISPHPLETFDPTTHTWISWSPLYCITFCFLLHDWIYVQSA